MNGAKRKSIHLKSFQREKSSHNLIMDVADGSDGDGGVRRVSLAVTPTLN